MPRGARSHARAWSSSRPRTQALRCSARRLPLQPVRGQVSWAAETGEALPPFPVNGDGHFIPHVPTSQGVAWFCGSTFDRDQVDRAPRDDDHRANQARLATPVARHRAAACPGILRWLAAGVDGRALRLGRPPAPARRGRAGVVGQHGNGFTRTDVRGPVCRVARRAGAWGAAASRATAGPGLGRGPLEAVGRPLRPGATGPAACRDAVACRSSPGRRRTRRGRARPSKHGTWKRSHGEWRVSQP